MSRGRRGGMCRERMCVVQMALLSCGGADGALICTRADGILIYSPKRMCGGANGALITLRLGVRIGFCDLSQA